jgi:hypothetical protein
VKATNTDAFNGDNNEFVTSTAKPRLERYCLLFGYFQYSSPYHHVLAHSHLPQP